MIDENKNEESTNIDESQAQENSTDESLNTEEHKEVDIQRIPYDRFKAKVDEANALKEKLAEIEREQEEAKRKELEEQNEYKELYEQAVADAEKAKTDALNTKKNALLAQAGYSEEQVAVLGGTIDGETDEELTKAVEELTSVIPPKKTYIDPTPMGAGEKPKPKGNEGLGRSLYDRVMGRK